MAILTYCFAAVSGQNWWDTFFNRVTTPNHKEINEHELYEGLTQEAKSTKYFKMKLTRNIYTSNQHLTFKVIADSFGSDPDIYIDKNNAYPTSSLNARWYCEKKGSDTCIVREGEFASGEILYFGIYCAEKCNYKLKTWYANVIDMTEANRKQMRFQAYSTTILKYKIPRQSAGKFTNSYEIQVEPEEQFQAIELFLSLDDKFQIIEEKPASHVSKTSIGLKFGNKDYQWCTECTIYAIVNIEVEDRYYITSVARAENDEFTTTLPTSIMVNPFQQDCYSYFVQETLADVRIDVDGFNGQADLYIVPWIEPSGPDSSNIVLRAAQGASRGVVLANTERASWGANTGSYSICFYAFTPFSGEITITEAEMGRTFYIKEGQIRTQVIQANDWIAQPYSNIGMNRQGTMNIYLENQNLKTDESPNRVYYKICSQGCSFDDNFNNNGFSEMTGGITTSNAREYTLIHDPNNCPNGDIAGCGYIFAIKNDYNEFKVVSFRVASQFQDPGDVDLKKRYINSLKEGDYFYYELNPNTNANIMPYLKELKIKMRAYRGDADLFASLSVQTPTQLNAQYQSRTGMQYDQLIFDYRDAQNVFKNSIYFSVFAETYCQYEISFEYTFLPEYNQLLEGATKLGEAQYQQTILAQEYDEKLFAFTPWWSARENRTVTFFADMIANKVFFYTKYERYPKHFATSIRDVNDTIAIYGNDKNHFNNGTYYTRIKPDFALADLIADRQYIFNMYAFSMAPQSTENSGAIGYDTLELGQEQIGFTNSTKYQDYRYFIMDNKASFNISLKRLPGYGNPIFFVSAISTTSGTAARETSWMFRSLPVDGYAGTYQSVKLTPNDLALRAPRCGTVLQSQQEDGEQACFLAISVTCNGTEQCAYKVKIEQEYVNSSRVINAEDATQGGFVPLPPGAIISQDYTNGRIANIRNVKYYYFPIDVNMMHDAAILLNKTAITAAGTNGDSYLIANIQGDTLQPDNNKFNYTEWQYPATNNQMVSSATGNSSRQEILEICNSKLLETCVNQNKVGCGVIVGVVGNTENQASDYRLKGFYGKDKLRLNEPRKINVNKGVYNDTSSYDYYWFVISDTVSNKDTQFEYQISVGTKNGGDPNLFVSLMDGRFPTSDDYDLASQQVGADTVRIAWNSSIWTERGWATTDGVMVVVGVKATFAQEYTIVLSTPPQAGSPLATMRRLEVGRSVEIELAALADQTKNRSLSMMFYMYNYNHGDFTLTLTMKRANGTIMYGKTGQLDRNQNIYTAIPINGTNAVVSYDVPVATFRRIDVKGSACYTCWYFINATFNSPETTSFTLTASEGIDDGGQYLSLGLSSPAEVYIRGRQAGKRKFILDSMDNWSLEGAVSTGDITIYIGLDPALLNDTIGRISTNNAPYVWKASASAGSTAKISVRQTDGNFHLATYYWVYIQSNSDQSAIVKLTLKQDRTVTFLPTDNDFTYTLQHPLFNYETMAQKFTFMTDKEQVKYHVFQVPPGTSSNPVYHQVTIVLTSLTPALYPMIYLKKAEHDREQATALGSLTYPSMVDADHQFGTNPFEILHTQTFSYTFYGKASKRYTYYTMAVYQQNWGLTGQLKSEYQMRIKNKIVTQAEAEAATTQSTSGSSSQDGITVTWTGESSLSSSTQSLFVDPKAEFIQ